MPRAFGQTRDYLSPEQEQAIVLLCEHKDWTHNQVAEELGIHRNTICAWFKSDLFKQKLHEELHSQFFDGSRPALRCMLEAVLNGDRQAAQYILDNTGFKLPDKNELAIGTTNDIKITIGE